ncbi:uncharacterized protein LOC107677926 [Sinocyclocheilus anshuiensis]|uniref:uncharacterized protein LOC107677926 n=1 Tax=Sinocyclocheilus anshuiensis TaxID=1608454 RepID=UPI0007B7BE9A|nr:PREDICTED: uncharacterized protein LOC107677926 [Sinocyclocheilus anshuiensis]
MADDSDQRSVLMEITEPQAKITGRLRRSYMDILSVGARHGTHGCGVRPGHAWDAGSGRRRSRGALDACEMSVSRQLLRSLLLAEQSVQMESGSFTSDLKLLLEDLHLKKTSVYRSIPYSRLASNRDAHCYRKARPHLMAFRRSCQDGGRLLLQNAEWEKLLEFVQAACRYTSELPQWETSTHNALREHCYNTLAAFCTAALQKHRPAVRRARELLRRFKMAPVSRRAISLCLEELEKILQEYQSGKSQTQIHP